FDRWGQDDFYGLAGFFNGMTRRPQKSEEFVFHAGYRETRLPLTNRLIPTRPPAGSLLRQQDGDPRPRLADWLTGSDNPLFALREHQPAPGNPTWPVPWSSPRPIYVPPIPPPTSRCSTTLPPSSSSTITTCRRWRG